MKTEIRAGIFALSLTFSIVFFSFAGIFLFYSLEQLNLNGFIMGLILLLTSSILFVVGINIHESEVIE